MCKNGRVCVAMAVCLSFFVFSAVRSPVPGINEPHFLSKAKHLWNPAWCRGDFFLESSNTHLVFYRTVGLFTRFLTLEQAVWIGRAVALTLLAVAWTALVSRLVPGRWSSLWSAWVLLALAAIGNYSGEWLVGGVEAKIFSYALVFWGIALLIDRRWNLAALSAGMAISFHPIVGMWSLACAGFAAIVSWRRKTDDRTPNGHITPGRALTAVGLLVVCSLPGLIPALQLIGTDAPKTRFQADFIQVEYRLAHHLDPMEFSRTAAAAYVALTFVWLIGRRWALLTEHERWFARFVVGTVLLAAAGLAVGFRPGPLKEMPFLEYRVRLMRFYPFRLSDVMVPLAGSVVLVGLVQAWLSHCSSKHSETSPKRQRGLPLFQSLRNSLAWLLFGGMMVFGLWWPGPDKNPSRMDPQQLSDWQAACRWVAAETPEKSLFLTQPSGSWAFKWYAQRPEYVSYKDCPQNPAGIVEWNRRLRGISQWAMRNYRDGFSNAELQELQAETGATHLITYRLGPFERLNRFGLEPVYRNRSYRIYQLDGGEQKKVGSRKSEVGTERLRTSHSQPSTLQSVTLQSAIGVPAPVGHPQSAIPKDYARVKFHAKPKPLPKGAVTHDWTCFLGPTHNAISTETKLIEKFPKDGLKLVWELEKGTGYASPAVLGDRLIFPHRVGDEVLVECLHPQTGQSYWRFKHETKYVDRFGYNNGPRASPVIHGDRVFVDSAEGELFCLKLDTGKLIWKRDLAGEYQVLQDFFGTVPTPLVEGGLLIANVGAAGGPCVVGLDLGTGKVMWEAGDKWGPGYASPVPATVHGKRRVFIFAGGDSRPPTGGLLSLDPATGKIDFEFPWRSRSYESVNASCPVVVGNRVFLSASYETGSALLKINDDFTHTVLWTTKEVGMHWNTAVHKDGHLYAFDGRNESDASLVCVELKTGKVVWRKEPEWDETVTVYGEKQTLTFSTFRGSLLHVDGRFLCLGEWGHLLWLDLSPKGCKQLDRTWPFAARESWALPVLSRGLLYLSQNRPDRINQTPRRLLCYDLRAE